MHWLKCNDMIYIQALLEYAPRYDFTQITTILLSNLHYCGTTSIIITRLSRLGIAGFKPRYMLIHFFRWWTLTSSGSFVSWPFNQVISRTQLSSPRLHSGCQFFFYLGTIVPLARLWQYCSIICYLIAGFTAVTYLLLPFGWFYRLPFIVKVCKR